VDVEVADAVDADAFQQLSQGDGDLTTTIASEIAVDRPPDILEGHPEQSIEFDSHFSDTSSVVVDQFLSVTQVPQYLVSHRALRHTSSFKPPMEKPGHPFGLNVTGTSLVG